MANYVSGEKRKNIFNLLCEGNGVRSIVRITGVTRQTVASLQQRYCSIIEHINRKYFTDLNIEEIEADELRTYIGNKKNIRWIYVALDRKSRAIIHFHIGARDEKDAKIFLTGLSYKLHTKSKVATDCLKSYISAVAKTPYGRIEAATNSIGLLRAQHLGQKLGRTITNRIETHNGNIRQHISRLTRRTRCFSKKEEELKQHLTLFFFYYNFIKIHKSIKTSPCVTAGIIDKRFTIEELLEYDLMFTDSTGYKRGKYEPRKNIQKAGAKIISINKVETKLETDQKKSRERWANELREAK